MLLHGECSCATKFTTVTNAVNNLLLCFACHSKVVAFCDHALSLKSGAGAKSAKVRYRRGKGKLMVGDYKAARADLEAALELCQEDGDERRAVERELKKLKVRRSVIHPDSKWQSNLISKPHFAA